jgi:hypothetical protein
MRTVGLIFIAACSSATPAPPQPESGRGSADTQTSRDGVLKAVFAALVAGDLEAALHVSYSGAVFEKAVDCPYRSDDPSKKMIEATTIDASNRESFGRTLGQTKGIGVEVLGIAADRDKSIKKGDKVGGICTALVDIGVHEFEVRIRVQRPPFGPYEYAADVDVAEIGGRWYVAELPWTIDDGEDARAADALAGFAERICACKDAACVAPIDAEREAYFEGHSKRSEDALARAGGIGELSNAPHVVATRKKRMDAASKLSDCRAKLKLPD